MPNCHFILFHSRSQTGKCNASMLGIFFTFVISFIYSKLFTYQLVYSPNLANKSGHLGSKWNNKVLEHEHSNSYKEYFT